MIKVIAAIGKNYELGNKGDLPLWKLKTDFERFKKLTTGHTVVMGKSTFNSLPENVRPLPGRKNVVLSTDSNLSIPDVTVYNTVESLVDALKDEPIVWIMGGGQIYKQFIHLADELHITHVDGDFQADTYFPFIDEDLWVPKHEEEIEKDTRNSHRTVYVVYRKI